MQMQKNKEKFAAIWQAYKSKEAVVPAEVPTVEQVEEPKPKKRIKIIQVKETICRDYIVQEPEVSSSLFVIFDPVFRENQPVFVLLKHIMPHRICYLSLLFDACMLKVYLFIDICVSEK